MPVPRYRCFCLTADNRVIAGAQIDAKDAPAAVAAARRRWRSVPGFHAVEVWLGRERLQPAVPREPRGS